MTIYTQLNIYTNNLTHFGAYHRPPDGQISKILVQAGVDLTKRLQSLVTGLDNSVRQEQDQMLQVSRRTFARTAKSTGLEKRNVREQEALEVTKSSTDLSSEEPDEVIPSEISTDCSEEYEEDEKSKGEKKKVKKKKEVKGDEKPKSKGEEKGKKETRCPVWQDVGVLDRTDTEEDDDVEFKHERRENQKQLLAQISRSLGEAELRSTSIFQPDERSLELAKRWVIRPILESSGRWIKFGGAEMEQIQQKVAEGIIPKGTMSVTGTASHYWSGLKQLLGRIQEREIKAGRSHKLVNNKLQLWQYFDWKGPKHLQFFRAGDFLEVLFTFKSHGMKKHALGGWNFLMAGPILKFSHTHTCISFSTSFNPNFQE